MRGSILTLSVLVVGCAAQTGADPEADLAQSGDGALSWEAFLETVERDPGDPEGWIVDGDVPIESDKRLVDFYESLFGGEGALTVARYGGRDAVWSGAQRRALTYCVSTTFGSRHGQVVAAMREATEAWEAVADVDFQHASDEDRRCDASNGAVIFDVRPVRGASYLARAFFPYSARRSRNVLVNDSSFTVRAPLSLVGIMRHELGHVLGFRHEHTRPEAGRCYEDGNWRGVTEYDRASVMHYPHCGGTDSALTLSALDAEGAAALYGAPSGSAPPAPPPSAGTPRSGTAEGSVSAGQTQSYRPVDVRAGSTFRVAMTGSGDADLYVRFDAAPTATEYDCRPYRGDSAETCELEVPAGASQAHFQVRGYAAATFRVEVSWTAP